jgi:hypothetical protein
MKLQFAG